MRPGTISRSQRDGVEVSSKSASRRIRGTSRLTLTAVVLHNPLIQRHARCQKTSDIGHRTSDILPIYRKLPAQRPGLGFHFGDDGRVAFGLQRAVDQTRDFNRFDGAETA